MMVGEISRAIPIYHEAMKSGWQDAWLDEPIELVVGCVLLLLSGIYWWTSALTGWQDVLATVTVVLGPWFVYRAWTRR